MSLNLERQLGFYGSYHRNEVNIAIHMVCVPLIFLSWITIATNSGTLIPLPSWLTVPHLPLNGGCIWAIGNAGFYMLLEPVAGTILFPFIMGWAALSVHLISNEPRITNTAAGIVFVSSWIAQFIGHGVYEKRAPALLNSLLQSLVLAPFFVFLETLFRRGYRPELRKRVNTAVEKQIDNWHAQEAKKVEKNGKAQ